MWGKCQGQDFVYFFCLHHLERPTALPARSDQNMKTRVRLKLHQAAMRSRRSCRDRGRPSEKMGDLSQLRARIAATVLAYEKHWSPTAIAEEFGWPLEAVQRWFEAGRPLL